MSFPLRTTAAVFRPTRTDFVSSGTGIASAAEGVRVARMEGQRPWSSLAAGLHSDKAEARQFQEWVTRDVLPVARRDGACRKALAYAPGAHEADDSGRWSRRPRTSCRRAGPLPWSGWSVERRAWQQRGPPRSRPSRPRVVAFAREHRFVLAGLPGAAVRATGRTTAGPRMAPPRTCRVVSFGRLLAAPVALAARVVAVGTTGRSVESYAASLPGTGARLTAVVPPEVV